ncbi:MAG: isochorismate synthase [Terrimesophilobacter sp.]
MSARESRIPALTVSTVEVEDPITLLGSLPPRQQLLWLRRGEGMVGFGTALRLQFAGPSRFADASESWRALVNAATVHDGVKLPGSGLIAFGTFAFAAESAVTSVLHVPSVIIGRRHGRGWITRIDADFGHPQNDGTATPPPARTPAAAQSISFTPGEFTPEKFLAAVDTALATIAAGQVSKVVLARELVGSLAEPSDTAPTLSALAESYPDCWTFAVDDFIGSSPETLVAVTNNTVTARVLAGSAARGSDVASDQQAALDLATSAKDQDEHQYAVHSVLSALRPHSPGVTASEMPFTLRLPNLWHLASDVEGSLSDGSTSLDLVEALHPTAAVAGTPTPTAVALIDEWEPFDRGRYAGPVGWMGADGDGEWAIALRCAQIEEDGTVRAYAGAGIVAESIPAHELAETSLKFRPIVDAFTP